MFLILWMCSLFSKKKKKEMTCQHRDCTLDVCIAEPMKELQETLRNNSSTAVSYKQESCLSGDSVKLLSTERCKTEVDWSHLMIFFILWEKLNPLRKITINKQASLMGILLQRTRIIRTIHTVGWQRGKGIGKKKKKQSQRLSKVQKWWQTSLILAVLLCQGHEILHQRIFRLSSYQLSVTYWISSFQW